jgi:hypothetical protein
MKPWTKQELQKLEDNADETMPRLVYLLQRSRQAIYKKRRELCQSSMEK